MTKHLKILIILSLALGFFGLGSGEKSVPLSQAAVEPIPNPSVIGYMPDVGEVKDVVLSADGNTAYLASANFGLVIVDMSNFQSPQVVSSQRPFLQGGANHVALSQNEKLAVVTGTPRGTDIVDISDRNNPKYLSSVSGGSSDAIFSGNYLYLAANGDLQIIDISLPTSPRVAVTLVTPGGMSGLAISGNYVLIADGFSGMAVADISNPLSPRIISALSLGTAHITKVDVAGNYAVFINSTYGKLQIINISNPAAPSLVSTSTAISAFNSLDVEGNLVAVCTNDHGMKIVDISNPALPQVVGQYNVSDTNFVSNGILIRNQKVYIAGANGGLVLLDITNLSVITQISKVQNTLNANQVTIDNIRNFAIAGNKIININNVEYPQIISTFSGNDGTSSVTSGNFIYATSNGDLKIFDATNLSSLSEILTVVTPGSAADVGISGSLAIVADSFSGVQIIDITNPSNARIVGAINLGGVVNKVIVKDEYAFVINASLGKLQVVDFSNASFPTKVGELYISSTIYSLTIQGNYLYCGTNAHGMYIINITNPASPTIVSSLSQGNFYNVYGITLDGNVAYGVNEYGVWVVDISNKSAPVLLGSNYPSIGRLKDVVFYQNKLFAASDTALVEIFDAFADKITLSKSADKYTVSSGDEVTYSLTATNTSPNTLTNLNLSDPIPAGTTYVAGSATGGGVYDAGQNKVSWTFDSIPPSGQAGAIKTVTFKVKIN